MMEQHQQPFRGHLKITSEKCDPPFSWGNVNFDHHL